MRRPTPKVDHADLVPLGHPSGAMRGQLCRIAEDAAVAMSVFDRDMRYLAASPAWIAWQGLTPGAVIGRSHYELFPDLPERWRAIHRRSLAGETCRCDRDVFVRADGSTQWLRWSVSPWRDESDAVAGIVILAEDVTETFRLRSSLESAEATIASLFETAVFGIAITDATGRYLRVNPAYQQLLGYTEGDLQGMCVGSTLHPDDLARELAGTDAVLRGTARMHESRCRLRRKDGEFLQVEQLVSALPAHRVGNPQVVVCARDITERSAMEARLRESDRLASIGMLGAGLGHDMRSVLFSMRCGLDLMARVDAGSGRTEDARPGVRQVDDGVEYLERLAEGLHALVVDGDAPLAEAERSTDLARWWKRTGPLIRRALPRGVAVEAELPEGLPPVEIGSAALSQAMLNLVVNAGQAIEAHADPKRQRGTVRIRVGPDGAGRGLRIEVGDDGVGMSEEIRRRAFEPFFTTRSANHGTGLGLSMVKRAIERAGGEIEIASSPGGGTRVCVRLRTVEAAPAS